MVKSIHQGFYPVTLVLGTSLAWFLPLQTDTMLKSPDLICFSELLDHLHFWYQIISLQIYLVVSGCLSV